MDSIKVVTSTKQYEIPFFLDLLDMELTLLNRVKLVISNVSNSKRNI